jgi:hypothetical protein
LSFAILTDNGSVLPVTKNSPELQNAWVWCSWEDDNNAAAFTKRNASAAKKRKHSQFPVDLHLPDVTLSSDDTSQRCEVEIEWNGIKFSEEFEVCVTVKNPSKWKLCFTSSFYQDHQCVRNNDHLDFMKKFQGVFLVDSFDNPLRSEEVLSQYKPKLEIFKILDTSTDEEGSIPHGNVQQIYIQSLSNQQLSNPFQANIGTEKPVTVKKLFEVELKLDYFNENDGKSAEDGDAMDVSSSGKSANNNTKKKTTDKAANSDYLLGFLVAKSGANKNIIFHEFENTSLLMKVSDEKNAFHSDEFLVKILRGRPHACCLSFPSTAISSYKNFTEKPVKSLTIDISRYSQINNLIIHIIDESSNSQHLGNYAELSLVKNISLEIIEKRKQKLAFSQRNLTSPKIVIPELNFSFAEALEAGRSSTPASDYDANVVRFDCKVYYEYHDRRLQLSPAELICHLTELNNIRDMKLSLVSSPAPNERGLPSLGRNENGQFIIKSTAGKPLPVLKLECITDDKQSYLPDLNRFEFKITKKSLLQHMEFQSISQKNINSTFLSSSQNESFSVLPNSSSLATFDAPMVLFSELYDFIRKDNYYLLQPKESFSTMKINHFDIKIIYNENRTALLNVLPENMKRVPCEMLLQIEEATIIDLFIKSESPLKTSVMYTYDDNIESHDLRTVGKEVTVYLIDSYGNLCSVPQGCEVNCKITTPDAISTSKMNSASSSSFDSCPKLDKSDSHGVLLGKPYNTQRIGSFFDRIILDTNSSTSFYADGEYILQFSFLKKSTAGSAQSDQVILTKDFSFQLISNVTTIQQKRKLQDEYNKLLFQLKEFQTLQNDLLTCENDILRLNDLPASSSLGISSEDGSNLIELRRLKMTLESKLREASEKQQSIRLAKKKLNHPDPLRVNSVGVQHLGQVVDLAFVNDFELAKILSLAAQKYMDAVVVNTTEEALQFYAAGIKTMILDQLSPFVIRKPSGTERRSEAEKLKKKLPVGPHRPGKFKNMENIPGNPRMMINLLQLTPENEELRDTLFWNIFSSSILFDNLSAALDYRREIVKAGLPIPFIYTVNGDRLDGTAMLSPVHTGSTSSASSSSSPISETQLSYIFGEQILTGSTLLLTIETSKNSFLLFFPCF